MTGNERQNGGPADGCQNAGFPLLGAKCPFRGGFRVVGLAPRAASGLGDARLRRLPRLRGEAVDSLSQRVGERAASPRQGRAFSEKTSLMGGAAMLGSVLLYFGVFRLVHLAPTSKTVDNSRYDSKNDTGY